MAFHTYFRKVLGKPSRATADRGALHRDPSWIHMGSRGQVHGQSRMERQGLAGSDRSDCSPESSEAIFELLGSSTNAACDTSAYERPGASTHTDRDDLLATLNEQYYHALESPYFLPNSEWVGSSANGIPGLGKEAMGERAHAEDDSSSIHSLLSDIDVLEEAFDALHEGSVSDLTGHDAVPEILRLFAPAEYHASAARRVETAPPPVARRDHHTLAIDSPLAALNPHIHHESNE
ncbi:TagK domain-containing protein [Paraburkholderia dipogonis]|uniref:TagK domain-containing protein n=2 Tax=Paraburkholderia dipogonis TaxID=1211383 RepID=A0A4Y8N6E6_9BURK|nr:TagK domain-containing protein [Paraburkholderia dipogonis]